MIMIQKIISITIACIFIVGCADKQPDIGSNKDIRIKINVTPSSDKFEKRLIEISKVSEAKYNQYIELLTLLKKKKILKKSKIPRNMGKRVSFAFDGYALMLVKKVSEESGYTINLDNIRIADSTVISRDYKDTMIVDVLEDVSEDLGYDLEIDEKNYEINVRMQR